MTGDRCRFTQMMRMIGLDDAHQCFQRCAWSDSFIRIILVNHLDLTDCEYTKKLCKLYLFRAIFAKDLNFFVHSSRLFVEISYLCHRIPQGVQDILLICSLELLPRKELTANLESKEYAFIALLHRLQEAVASLREHVAGQRFSYEC